MKYLHTMVRVTNIEKSLDFYCNKLGLREINRHESEEGRFTLVFLSAPNNEEAQIELTYNWDSENYDEGRNFGHVAYSVEDIYETFITHVSEGRGMSKLDVDKIGQGRVWSGIDALEVGLIDQIGGLEDAIVSAAELCELEDYRVVSLPKKTDEIEELLKGLTMKQNVFLKEILNVSDEAIEQIKFLNSRDKIQTILPYIIDIH